MDIKEFFNNIINKIRKPKQKFLNGEIDPKYAIKTKSKQQKWREQNKYRGEIRPIKEETSLEDCILEYITKYIQQVDAGMKGDISYKAFTRMFYDSSEEPGHNLENQAKLKERIHKNDRYRIDGQYSNDRPVFYHISENTLRAQRISDDDENLQRIYLNCERKNIAKLTEEVFKEISKIKDCPLKMKFIAEAKEIGFNKNYQRNDKIVIYTTNEIDKERIINSITQLRNKKPELFSDSKELPLMPKVNGFIGCVKNGKKTVQTPLYPRIAETYNSKLSAIMEDCLLVSLREISARDKNLVYSINAYYGNDVKEYLKTYKAMSPKQIDEVVKMFKSELIESCEKSNVNIEYRDDYAIKDISK